MNYKITATNNSKPINFSKENAIMIESGKYINAIIEKLNIFRQGLISKNKLGLFDESIHAENFIRDLLNILHDYKLKNLNAVNSNFPGIDLYDPEKKIGIQITSNNTSKKINETLRKIDSNKSKFNELKELGSINFFILTAKQKSYSIKNIPINYSFDPNNDIWDFDDFYKQVLESDLIIQKKIAEYIGQQIEDISKKVGLNAQYNIGPFWKKIEW